MEDTSNETKENSCPNRGVDTVFVLRNQRAPPNFANSKAFIINVARRLISPKTPNVVDDDEIMGRHNEKRANGVGLVTYDSLAQVVFPLTSPFTEAEFARFEQAVNAVQPASTAVALGTDLDRIDLGIATAAGQFTEDVFRPRVIAVVTTGNPDQDVIACSNANSAAQEKSIRLFAVAYEGDSLLENYMERQVAPGNTYYFETSAEFNSAVSGNSEFPEGLVNVMVGDICTATPPLCRPCGNRPDGANCGDCPKTPLPILVGKTPRQRANPFLWACADGGNHCGPSTAPGCRPSSHPGPDPSPTPGEGWILVCRQTVPYLFSPGQLVVNPWDPENDNYAILDQLERFRYKDGYFVFLLRYPKYNIQQVWRQTSNPVLDETGACCYEAILIDTKQNGWRGLARQYDQRFPTALMDGTDDLSPFYSVGAYQFYGQNQGIQGFSRLFGVDQVELYAHVPDLSVMLCAPPPRVPGVGISECRRALLGSQATYVCQGGFFSSTGRHLMRAQCRLVGKNILTPQWVNIPIEGDCITYNDGDACDGPSRHGHSDISHCGPSRGPAKSDHRRPGVAPSKQPSPHVAPSPAPGRCYTDEYDDASSVSSSSSASHRRREAEFKLRQMSQRLRKQARCRY